MLKLTWTENGLEDLEWWHQHNSKMLKRIIKLSLETCKNPLSGIGKPEPLKFNLQGYWSRRILTDIVLFTLLIMNKSLLFNVVIIMVIDNVVIHFAVINLLIHLRKD